MGNGQNARVDGARTNERTNEGMFCKGMRLLTVTRLDSLKYSGTPSEVSTSKTSRAAVEMWSDLRASMRADSSTTGEGEDERGRREGRGLVGGYRSGRSGKGRRVEKERRLVDGKANSRGPRLVLITTAPLGSRANSLAPIRPFVDTDRGTCTERTSVFRRSCKRGTNDQLDSTRLLTPASKPNSPHRERKRKSLQPRDPEKACSGCSS